MDTGGKSPDLPVIQGAPPDLRDAMQMRIGRINNRANIHFQMRITLISEIFIFMG